jgi:fibrillarin-like rRNA methylase
LTPGGAGAGRGARGFHSRPACENCDVDQPVNKLETFGVDANEWTAIKQLVDRLQLIYPDVSSETIATVVHHNHARFDGRPVRYFVPLFVERGARKQLALLAV